MNIAIHFPIYQRRESAAQIGTLLLGVVILLLSQTMIVHHEEPLAEIPVSLTILPPPVAPEKIVEKIVEQPVVQPPPQKMVEPVPQQTPVAATPAPVPSPVALPNLPVSPTQQAIPEHLEMPHSNSAAESLFAQDVRVSIERKKIYPETARDLGMTGAVEVMYVLDRSGKLIKAEIIASSGYKLLDKAALAAVQSASYKAFPADAWIGEGSKEFRTRLVFSIND
ncbi:MAG: energy transducer TonB [Nitrosomonadales bacterium]|nr:energy transducer TonB [Nitrosomonadales bacterium]